MLSIPYSVFQRLLKEHQIEYEKQIDKLHGENEHLARINNKLQAEIHRFSRSAKFYDQLIKTIDSDPMLQDAWVAFIATIKLRVENPVPGITCPE